MHSLKQTTLCTSHLMAIQQQNLGHTEAGEGANWHTYTHSGWGSALGVVHNCSLLTGRFS